MNKKQTIVCGCFIAIVVVGFIRAQILIRKGVLPQKFDFVVLLIVIMLAVVSVVLGKAFREKNGQQ